MNRFLFGPFWRSVWTISLLLTLHCGAAQFVELTAEIQSCDWDYLFFSDRLGKYPGESNIPSIFTENQTRHLVIGADTWMIESSYPGFDVTRWFTGTNIIEHTLIKQQTPEAVVRKMSQQSRLAMSAPPVGHRSTRIHQSIDGNPGRPVRVADVISFDLSAAVSWLAFCSGPTLKREGRQIFPPSSFWKESSIVYYGWSDVTEVFKDDLGLPRSINLITTNNQSIFQYQVRQSTNVLGWSIPLEFYGVQYLLTGTNAWKLHLTFKGRVTSIGPATQPEIPPEVMNVIQQ